MASLRRSDLLALANLRNDGRKPSEIRRMRCRLGPVANAYTSSSSGGGASGSALVHMGLTTVLAVVRGPAECSRRSEELPDRAVLDVTVRTAPFSSSTGDRRSTNPSTDRRLIEQSSLLRRVLEASILLTLHPKSRIEVDVTILADDGGRLCAAINASTLALVDAGVPLRDLACACSAGLVPGAGAGSGDVALIDLNRSETMTIGGSGGGGRIGSGSDGAVSAYLPCAALPQRGTVVLAQCESRLADANQFKIILDAALEGCRAVFDVMSAAVRERAGSLLAAKEGRARVVTPFEYTG